MKPDTAWKWHCLTCGGKSPYPPKPANCGSDAGCDWREKDPPDSDADKLWESIRDACVER
jgi:hypothetical protein